MNKSQNCTIIKEDVRNTDWMTKIQINPNIIASNLPYLPCLNNSLPKEVDGGNDGLKFIPNLVIDTAEALNVERVIINLSSLCHIEKFAHFVTVRGYKVESIVARFAPLGEYGKKVEDYLKKNGFSTFFGTTENYQIIYSVVLIKKEGLPTSLAFKKAAKTLHKFANNTNVMIYGILPQKIGAPCNSIP